MTVELTVIIPSYNTGDFIAEAVLSVSQDVPQAEIIVVDDASTDDTVENLSQLQLGNLSVVQLQENSPGGAGHPSNVGLERARGKYIAFVDSDDFFYRGYLSRMLNQIKLSQTDICVASYKQVDTVTHRESPAHDERTWQTLSLNRPAGCMSKEQYFTLSPEPWRKIYRADLFTNEDVRFPVNGWFNEDYPFHWFVGLQSGRGISYVNSDSYLHRVSRQGQTTAELDERIFFVFDHTENISEFMRKDDRYTGYEGYLLNWLLIGAWKLGKLTVNLDQYYKRYRDLLLSFSDSAIAQFSQFAQHRERRVFKAIQASPEANDVIRVLV